ncbi:MAG: dUTP diphosphatase [Deltaproteobacteria bacterium]|nr:dUTP diphosphatase [Deltaproteobacteria bacterium]MBW2659967.1 dUTP diphosphatase [Deltaproteobacteria bacterium]
MKSISVKFCWLHCSNESELNLPRYETGGAAGMDVEAAVEGSVVIDPGERVLLPTGFAVALPEGYEFQVRPRSGLAVKHGVTLVNSPGTIDADYRGEVQIALINLSKKSYTVARGDRIAQLVLADVARARLQLVTELDETRRGSGGFGHTGA